MLLPEYTKTPLLCIVLQHNNVRARIGVIRVKNTG